MLFQDFLKNPCPFLYGKKPQAYRLTVCAAGSGSVAAMKDGIHARGARVIRQPPPFSLTSRRMALTRRAPCACGRGVSSRSYFPHGVFRRGLRTLCGTQTRVGSRGYTLPSRSMRVRDGVSVNLLVLFSLRRKVHIFLLFKEEKEKARQSRALPFPYIFWQRMLQIF